MGVTAQWPPLAKKLLLAVRAVVSEAETENAAGLLAEVTVPNDVFRRLTHVLQDIHHEEGKPAVMKFTGGGGKYDREAFDKAMADPTIPTRHTHEPGYFCITGLHERCKGKSRHLLGEHADGKRTMYKMYNTCSCECHEVKEKTDGATN